MKLTNACPYFESLAAFATLSPVNQKTIEANGDSWAVKPETYISNGPFMITEWVPGSYILTMANPNYWNKDAIKLDGITDRGFECLLQRISDRRSTHDQGCSHRRGSFA